MAGTPLKGLNYLKGRDDHVALPDEDYPEWLWRCLDVKKAKDGKDDEGAGDEFCMCYYFFPFLPLLHPHPSLNN